MALEQFTLQTLSTVDDGRIAVAFEQALRRCELDCRDRPTLDKARTISIDAKLTPRVDESGRDLLEVLVQFEVRDSQPVRTSKVYHMVAARSGLYFNELAPEDARQLTLDTAAGPKPLTEPAPQRKDVHAG